MKLTTKITLSVLAGFIVSFTAAQGEQFTLGAGGTEPRQQVAVQSSTDFEDFIGTTTVITGDITFDREANTGSGTLVVDGTTIDTGIEERNGHMRGADWMNFNEYPEVRFEIENVTHLEGDNYEVSGPLTMSGQTVEITAPATVRYLPASDETAAARLEGDIVAVQTTFPVVLSDFGIDRPAPERVADELELNVRFFASNAQ